MHNMAQSTSLIARLRSGNNSCPRRFKVVLAQGIVVTCLAIYAMSGWSQDLNTLNQNFASTDAAEKSKDFGEEDPGTYTYKLIGVNSFYYSYATAITAQDQGLAAFDAISKFFPAGAIAPAAPTACELAVNKVASDIKKMTPPTFDTSKHVYSSISLGDTQQDWIKNVGDDKTGDYANLLNTPGCNTGSTAAQYKAVTDAHDRLFPGFGIPNVTASIPVKACKNYTVTVSEFFQGVPTGESRTAKLSASCDILTFSAGPLFTEIQNPTYNSRPNPNGAGQVLSIENGGQFRPTGVGLLNYNWPALNNGWLLDPIRLGISTGPVFQSSQNSASVFGWFVGGSVSIYKYLVLSAGEHFGQFAGPPFGLSNGQPIPPNYGNLTASLRYTARFAFGITFRTNDISKAFKGGTQTPSVTAKP